VAHTLAKKHTPMKLSKLIRAMFYDEQQEEEWNRN
jgi:hypothetical protein